MKKIFVIFTLFFCSIIYGQAQLGEYIIESHCKIKAHNENYGGGCKNQVLIEILFDKGRRKILEQDLNGVSQNHYSDYGIKKNNVPATWSPLLLRSVASRNWKRRVGGCGGNGTFNDSEKLERIYFCGNFFENSEAIDWWDHIISVKIYPQLVIRTKDGGDLPSKDKIKIESDYGFRSVDYNWQYDIGDGYMNLSKFNGQSTIEVNAYDILGSRMEEFIGQKISFIQRSSCGNISDPVFFTVKKSLPILKNDNNDVIITNCYGDKANYTLRFDRPLKEGEKMSFNIKKNGSLLASYNNKEKLDEDNTFTFENLEAGTYEVSYLGNSSANSYSPYTEEHPFIFTIKNPDPVKFFIIQPKNPSCNEGNDGEIYIGAYGGVHNYKIQINNSEWQDFTSPRGTHHIENLSSGKYTIRVKDTNGCIGRDRWNDNKETITVELKAPEPITISYPPDRQKLPSFNGASDGYITAVIKGGTPLYFGEKKYNFVWENANGDILANTEYNFDSVTGEFSVILRNVREGNYFLSVYDKNYDSNNNKRVNCAKLRSQYYLSHPEKLKASIELSNPISCNSQNEFGDEKDKNPYDGQRDESQDGELKIEASGGTPFTGTQNGGKPYIYTWKKQDSNGYWVTLPIEDDTAKNLSAGKYAINIQDANGIVLGEYNTHTVTKVVDVVYELKEPAKLTLSLQKTDATCKGNDGKITATPAGGTPPYTYLWSNGATTASIENLLPMPYTVEIKDGAGCMVQGSTAVLQPNSLTVTGTITPLRCHNANNATIALAVQGGTAPYQYLWNTGATTANINNLPTGEYKVKITDAQGCAHFKTFTIENPPKFEIDLGENRTLCNGQTLTLNIAINAPQATYLWTSDNGFSSNMPQVTLSEKGTYRATVTTKDGCTATDAITIESANTQIASEFLLTTQAYENEEVILVNTSSPKGETTEWLVPENEAIEITNKSEDYISLIFKAKGEYRIGIKQTQGNCFELFYKNIIVEPATDLPKTQKNNEAFVREFEVAPNPNDGKFKAKVVLEKAGAIKFRLYSITGQLVSEKNSASATEHWVDFQDPLPAATYILVLETPYQRLSKKIIIIP
jgi:putative PKD domain containing protein